MTKVAILIDGAYLLKRLSDVCPGIDIMDAEAVANSIERLVLGHLAQLNEVYGQRCETHGDQSLFRLLYRTFYYDARPYNQKVQLPISEKMKNYANSDQAMFRNALFDILRHRPRFAVRLGDVRKTKDSWILKAEAQKQLLKGEKNVGQLGDEDFNPAFHQKGVDMRIGVDIASITLKRQANIIILVSGDADFVPAAKCARREGVQFILDPLRRGVHPDLFEHIDLLQNGFDRPKRATRR